MRAIQDPNVQTYGKSNLLYDGEKLVVVGSQCGPVAVRVFLNQKGPDLVALFGAFSNIPRNVHVAPVNVQSVAAHAMIDEASQTFTNGNSVGGEWYDADGPLPLTTDEAQLALANSHSCGGSGGSTVVLVTPPADPETPGTPTPPTVPETPAVPGCNGSPTCGGGNDGGGGSHGGHDGGGGSVENSPNENDNGGNTPPGYEDSQSDAAAVVQKAITRVNGFAPSFS